MNKNSKIYSSIPFQRHIKRKNWKIFMAEPQKKTLKTHFLPHSLQSQNNQKNLYTIPHVFWIPLQQNKIENRTTTGRCLVVTLSYIFSSMFSSLWQLVALTSYTLILVQYINKRLGDYTLLLKRCDFLTYMYSIVTFNGL